MKTLKKLGSVLAVLAVLFVLGSLFLPSQIRVERSATIQAPPDKVFAQINTLTNWEVWSPWHKLDPRMSLTYQGPASGVGAKYSWSSQQRNVGSGTLAITESVQDQRILTDMQFSDGRAIGAFELTPSEGGTKVIWSMQSDLGRNPVARYFGLLMDGMIGADFERGLQNLKTVCENNR